jgi:hypothetical protein
MQCSAMRCRQGCVCVFTRCTYVRLIEIEIVVRWYWVAAHRGCSLLLGRVVLGRRVVLILLPVPMRWLDLGVHLSISFSLCSVYFFWLVCFEPARHAEEKSVGRKNTEQPTAESRAEQSRAEQVTGVEDCDPWDEPCRLQMRVPLVMCVHVKFAFMNHSPLMIESGRSSQWLCLYRCQVTAEAYVFSTYRPAVHARR